MLLPLQRVATLDYLWPKQPQDAAEIAVYSFLNPLPIEGYTVEGNCYSTSQMHRQNSLFCLYERVKLKVAIELRHTFSQASKLQIKLIANKIATRDCDS